MQSLSFSVMFYTWVKKEKKNINLLPGLGRKTKPGLKSNPLKDFSSAVDRAAPGFLIPRLERLD